MFVCSLTEKININCGRIISVHIVIIFIWFPLILFFWIYNTNINIWMVKNSKDIKIYTWKVVLTPLSFNYSLLHSNQEKNIVLSFFFILPEVFQEYINTCIHFSFPFFFFLQKRSKPYTWFYPLILFFNNICRHRFISVHTDLLQSYDK